MVRYDEVFKRNAVSMLMDIKQEGIYEDDLGNKFENVRQLCLGLDISSSTLYRWAEEQGVVIDGSKKKSETKHIKTQSESNETLEENEEGIYGEPWSVPDLEGNDVDIFGIRFWGFVGKNLKIPNYASIPISQLKLKIGLKLMKQSGLVKTIG